MSGISWGQFVVPLLVGIIVGIVGQSARYRYSRRLETREKLGQPLDIAFGIISDLHRDISYLKSLLSHGATAGSTTFAAVDQRLRANFHEFIGWHKDFGKAIELELRYRNSALLASIGRVVVLANQAGDPAFRLPVHFDVLEQDLNSCMKRIERFYRSF